MASGLSKAHQRQHKSNEGRRKAYRTNDTRNVNKAIRLVRVLERTPWDALAHAALSKINAVTLKRAGVTVPKLGPSPTQIRARDGVTLTKLQRQRALDKLTRLSQDMGAYDLETASA